METISIKRAFLSWSYFWCMSKSRPVLEEPKIRIWMNEFTQKEHYDISFYTTILGPVFKCFDT